MATQESWGWMAWGLLVFLLNNSSIEIKPHTIRFTLLTYTILCVLVYSHTCSTIITLSFQNTSITPKKKSHALAVTPHSLLLSPGARGNQYSTFCLYGFPCSGQFFPFHGITQRVVFETAQVWISAPELKSCVTFIQFSWNFPICEMELKSQ